MKKIYFLLIAISIVGLASINACKSSTKPNQSTETVVQELTDTLKQAADTSAEYIDTTDAVEE